MPNNIVFNIQINGTEQAITDVTTLEESLQSVADVFPEIEENANLDSASSGLDNISDSAENASTSVAGIGTSFESTSESSTSSIENINENLKQLEQNAVSTGAPIKSFGQNLDNAANSAQKGLKGLSSVLRVVGVDTEILDDLENGLQAVGDLLKSQEKLSKVAFDSAPLKEQVEAVGELANAQKTTATATATATSAQVAQTTATGAATVATRVLSTALKALPWIAVASGIIAVVGALVKYGKETEEVTKKVKDNGEEIERLFGANTAELQKRADSLKASSDDAILKLEKELELLEINGASQDVIFKKKSEIIKLSQNSKQALIDELKLQNDLIQNQNQRITNTETKNKLVVQSIGLEKESLIQANKELDALNAKLEKDKENVDLQSEVLNKKKQVAIFEENISKLESTRKDNLVEITNLERQLSISKEFDQKILTASNEKDKERLQLLKEQSLENLKNDIEEVKKNFADFDKQIQDVGSNLQGDLLNTRFKFSVDSKQFVEAEQILEEIVSRTNKSITEQTETEFNNQKDKIAGLIEEQKTQISSLSESIEKTVQTIAGKSVKFETFSELVIDVDKTKTRIEELNKSTEEYKEQLKTVEVGSDAYIEISNSISKNEKEVKTLTSTLSKTETQLKSLKKAGNFTDKEFIDVSQSIIELETLKSSVKDNEEAYSKYVETTVNEETGIESNAIKDQIALKNTIEVIDDVENKVSSLSSSIGGDVKESFSGFGAEIEKQLKNISANIQGGNITIPFNYQLQGDLLGDVDEKVKATKAKLEEYRKSIIEALKVNPNLSKEALDALVKNVNEAFDKMNADVDAKGADLKNGIKKVFSDSQKDAIRSFEAIAQAGLQLFEQLTELANQRLEQQIDELEREQETRDEFYELALERNQEYQDAQAQTAEQTKNKIESLEEQLKTSRGNRSLFLLKLIATEQQNLKKAEAEKARLAKDAENLEKQKEEEDRARKARANQLAKKQFENTKALQYATAIVNTAAAVLQALASVPPPYSFVVAALTAAAGAVEVATIANTTFQPVTLEQGGLLKGASHADGGIVGEDIDKKKGRFGNIEVEGDEYVVNKKSTKNNLEIIERINKEGKDKKFELVERTNNDETKTELVKFFKENTKSLSYEEVSKLSPEDLSTIKSENQVVDSKTNKTNKIDSVEDVQKNITRISKMNEVLDEINKKKKRENKEMFAKGGLLTTTNNYYNSTSTSNNNLSTYKMSNGGLLSISSKSYTSSLRSTVNKMADGGVLLPQTITSSQLPEFVKVADITAQPVTNTEKTLSSLQNINVQIDPEPIRQAIIEGMDGIVIETSLVDVATGINRVTRLREDSRI